MNQKKEGFTGTPSRKAAPMMLGLLLTGSAITTLAAQGATPEQS